MTNNSQNSKENRMKNEFASHSCLSWPLPPSLPSPVMLLWGTHVVPFHTLSEDGEGAAPRCMAWSIPEWGSTRDIWPNLCYWAARCSLIVITLQAFLPALSGGFPGLLIHTFQRVLYLKPSMQSKHLGGWVWRVVTGWRPAWATYQDPLKTRHTTTRSHCPVILHPQCVIRTHYNSIRDTYSYLNLQVLDYSWFWWFLKSFLAGWWWHTPLFSSTQEAETDRPLSSKPICSTE